MTETNATRAAGRSAPACSAYRIPYDRDDARYEYIEQGHMFVYPSEKAGWEQIVRHDGMPGQPTSPCFYVWRRARRPNTAYTVDCLRDLADFVGKMNAGM
jgi:hypothetical protein